MKIWPWVVGGGIGAWLLWPKSSGSSSATATSVQGTRRHTLELFRVFPSVSDANLVVQFLNTVARAKMAYVGPCYTRNSTDLSRAVFTDAFVTERKDALGNFQDALVSIPFSVDQEAYLEWRGDSQRINACANGRLTDVLAELQK